MQSAMVLSHCMPKAALQAPRSLGPRARRAPFFHPIKTQARRPVSIRVHGAAKGKWPDPEFIEETIAAFPEKGIADVEEARVLFSSGGYTFLDVRSEAEVEDSGKVRGSVNVPMVRARKVYSPEAQKKLVASEPVDPDDWIAQVAKRFPNRGTPLLVGGSADGRHLVLEALQALEDAGYTNIVKLKGGYDAWSQVFDFKLGRKRAPTQGSSRAASRPDPSGGAAGWSGAGHGAEAAFDAARDAREHSWNESQVAHAHAEATRSNGHVPNRAVQVQANGLEGNPLFSSQFMNVLSESLARQGPDALTANTRPEEPRISATEEVLVAAVSQSKQTLVLMCQIRDQLDKQIATQQKQVERLEFALNKCKGDAAYLNALKDMLHES